MNNDHQKELEILEAKFLMYKDIKTYAILFPFLLLLSFVVGMFILDLGKPNQGGRNIFIDQYALTGGISSTLLIYIITKLIKRNISSLAIIRLLFDDSYKVPSKGFVYFSNMWLTFICTLIPFIITFILFFDGLVPNKEEPFAYLYIMGGAFLIALLVPNTATKTINKIIKLFLVRHNEGFHGARALNSFYQILIFASMFPAFILSMYLSEALDSALPIATIPTSFVIISFIALRINGKCRYQDKSSVRENQND